MAADCRRHIGAGDLTGAAAAAAAAAAAVIPGSRSTSVAAMDAKYRPNVAEQTWTSGVTRTEQAEVSCGVTDGRQTANDDVVATKEVEVCTVLHCDFKSPVIMSSV